MCSSLRPLSGNVNRWKVLRYAFHIRSFNTTSLCSVFRWLLLEICVRYAKKRCMFPSFYAANTSFVKIVYPNGNSHTPSPVVYHAAFSLHYFHTSSNDFITYMCFLGIVCTMAGLRGSERAHCAGHWWSQQTSGRLVMDQQASSSSYSKFLI